LVLKQIFGLMALTSCVAFGSTIMIAGPEFFNGTTFTQCTPGVGHCIDGDPTIYTVFSLSITSPTTPGGLWTVDLETNYGTTIPAGSHTIPSYAYSGDPSTPEHQFYIGDILFQQGNLFYGLVLSPHDGYTVGDFYQVSGFQNSNTVLTNGGVPPATQGGGIPRPTLNVEVAAGGVATQMPGTLTVNPNPGSNGTNFAEYSIVDTFAAPASFLNSPFTVDATSYACANGYLEGGGGGFTGGTGGSTPEPSSWLLILPGLVLVGVAQMRKRRT
jgi:hypothetical protein